MGKIKGFTKRLRRIWNIGLDMDTIFDMMQTTREELNKAEKDIGHLSLMEARMNHKLAAIQAIDMDFLGTGKIVIAARVDGKDYVKIIDIPEKQYLNQWKQMVEQIETSYGAKANFIDAPGPLDKYLIGRW